MLIDICKKCNTLLATHGDTCEFCHDTGVEIEGKKVEMDDIGSPVTYIPPHADNDASHPDSERGHISTLRDGKIWVRFHAPNGALVNPNNLIWG
jgi:hypothetical protein